MGEVYGMRELERVLNGLPRASSEFALSSALRAGANIVRKEARERAPMADSSPINNKGYVRAKRKYGHLRDNIRVTKTRHRAGAAQMTIHSGRAFWGMFLEFGTVKMGARPWLSPAFEATYKAAQALIRARLAVTLRQTAGQLAGPRSRWTKAFRRRVAG